ncbi:hypothetical protein NEUTE1DRAFT_111574 [Neurospora tetrasperma FGSC 2508]|uniref:Uncharacterized protein n=1 Tax=Neurospora tetrasperma (strain FGSC 2508 / ATCC MYA-4615 / P0657) TaxID=510951 RepID=F8MRZ8_NEUT8|nr:uncharacterized protein NEUTE1DRAFT_111574 [Neurospora tetrasperma FGSC 2508]EGO54992.1 hypothetical protein NEUTE1DRAFT_111574 [Neurospora tetrasperma FGSC 2508]EGZ69806.1 hypothetical protein NEUTE2DRAFT_72073 [Neurospora tetrasperma FGSC 2509]
MAPITISRVLCGLLLFLGIFALLADTTKPGSGQLSKAETRRPVSTTTHAPLVVRRSTRTTTIFTTANVTPVSNISTTTTTSKTALARAEPTPSNVVIIINVPTPAPGAPTRGAVIIIEPSHTPLLRAAPLPDDLVALDRDNHLVSCYKFGWWSERRKFIRSITDFCHALDGESMSPVGTRHPLTGFHQHQWNWMDRGFELIVEVHIVISLEVMEGCEWVFDEGECGRYLRMPVDLCDTDSEHHKKGGTVVGRTSYGGEKEGKTCLLWRVDWEGLHVSDAEPVEGYEDGIGV